MICGLRWLIQLELKRVFFSNTISVLSMACAVRSVACALSIPWKETTKAVFSVRNGYRHSNAENV